MVARVVAEALIGDRRDAVVLVVVVRENEKMNEDSTRLLLERHGC